MIIYQLLRREKLKRHLVLVCHGYYVKGLVMSKNHVISMNSKNHLTLTEMKARKHGYQNIEISVFFFIIFCTLNESRLQEDY